MKDYGVVNANVEGVGVNPYLLGVNYARLGLSKNKIEKSYSRTAYDNAWFEKVYEGYNNAESDTTPTINRPQKDTRYIFNNLCKNYYMTNFSISDVEYEESSGDNFFISGQGSTTKITLLHKRKQIKFVIKYKETLYTDGSYSCHWSIDTIIKIVRAKFDTLQHFMGIVWKVEDQYMDFKFITCFRGASEYELVLNTIEHRSKHNNIPNSKIITKLIHKITEEFLKCGKILPTNIQLGAWHV